MEDRQRGAYYIHIHKHPGTYENNPNIVCRSLEGERIAIKTLMHSALKIYLYLSSMQNSFAMFLLSAQCQEELSISRGAFTRAMKDLKDNGFLIKDKLTPSWHFYDLPPEGEEEE